MAEAKQVEAESVPIVQLDQVFFRPALFDNRFQSSEYHSFSPLNSYG